MQKYNLAKLLSNRTDLNWFSPDPSKLDDKPTLEAILNYGDWTDFKKILTIMGKNEFKKLFYAIAHSSRTNLRPEIKNYFSLYINANLQ